MFWLPPSFLVILPHVFSSPDNLYKFLLMSSLYVHFPFCRSRCLYCAFFSCVGNKALHAPYVDALKRELETYTQWIADNAPVKTLYFGGGTPSSLSPQLILQLSSFINEMFSDALQITEFTLEVNPEDVNPQNVEQWLLSGITRFSMGVQSMVPAELHAIGRRHSPDDVRNAAHLLLQHADLSMDLICGLPGQSLDSFLYSVDCLLEMNPAHISVYMLELEKNSILTKLIENGKKHIPDDVAVSEMYLKMCRKLSDAGYEHYEISNFALPGKHSRHNCSYWDGTPYLGIGPSAAGYPRYRERYCNAANLDSYIRNGAMKEMEILTNYDLRTEYLLTRLRTSAGIDLHDFSACFGTDETSILLNKAASWIYDNKLEIKENRLRLSSPEACLVSDAIMASLL